MDAGVEVDEDLHLPYAAPAAAVPLPEGPSSSLVHFHPHLLVPGPALANSLYASYFPFAAGPPAAAPPRFFFYRTSSSGPAGRAMTERAQYPFSGQPAGWRKLEEGKKEGDWVSMAAEEAGGVEEI